MKRKIVLLASFLVTTLLSQTGFTKTSLQTSHPEPLHCKAEFRGLPFYSVEIDGSPEGIGPVQCFYRKNEQKAQYKWSTEYYYRSVSGPWHSTMPGTTWCGINTGGGFDSCTFQELIK